MERVGREEMGGRKEKREKGMDEGWEGKGRREVKGEEEKERERRRGDRKGEDPKGWFTPMFRILKNTLKKSLHPLATLMFISCCHTHFA